ncbi:hypothetical protein ETD86_01710 [Nonomuraea turkmeniaca]|uniref:Uncharacterized protein n=1 Tax=Nonomuraea turkmeniaca TaxID=103838 RepID=A0A5S4GGL0_9ACTN|nr:hypothetical protein [Nonomuraea turkmeniaca]TMR25330.1 hypothetical protein ETD86_01710 [Nonomuraea turkmeniaca]
MTGNAGAAKILDQLAGADVANLVNTFYAAMMNVYGVLAAGFVVQALLRLRTDEAGGTAEAVLATAVGRVRWVIAHLACAVIGATALLVAAGAGMGLADAAVGGVTGVGPLMGAGLAQLPAARPWPASSFSLSACCPG